MEKRFLQFHLPNFDPEIISRLLAALGEVELFTLDGSLYDKCIIGWNPISRDGERRCVVFKCSSAQAVGV